MPNKDIDIRRALDRERSRRRTASRIAMGLCPRCGSQPPEADRSVCAACSEKRRVADRARAAERRAAGIGRVRDPNSRQGEYARARQRAADRLAQGLCGKCGRHPHEPDRRLCAACGEQERSSGRERYRSGRAASRPYGRRNPRSRRRQARTRSRKRQRARREAHVCIRCGNHPPVEGGSSCEPCLRKRRAADRQTCASRRTAGLCSRCATPTFQGVPLCGPCEVVEARRQTKKYAADRARYARRRARQRCTHCGRRPTFGASRCEPCARRSYERSDHVRGLPVYPPSFTIVELETEECHGTFDRWEDVLLALSFARLSLEQVEVTSLGEIVRNVADGWAGNSRWVSD